MKAALKSARESLTRKSYKEALLFCKQALKEDKNSYEAYLIVGKAAFHLGEFHQARLAYERASEIRPEVPSCWQGLAELCTASEDWHGAAAAYQRLVQLAQEGSSSLQAKATLYVRRLAEAQFCMGQLEAAEEELQALLDADLSSQDWLDTTCQLADVQMAADSAELEERVQEALTSARDERQRRGDGNEVDEAALRAGVEAQWDVDALDHDSDRACNTLRQIVAAAPATPRYAQYHEALLKRLRRAIQVPNAGSMERHIRRLNLLQQCRSTISGRIGDAIGGCASPYPYEVALRMLEVEEEVATNPSRGPSQDGSSMWTPSGMFTPSGGNFTPGLHASGSPRTGSIAASPRVSSTQLPMMPLLSPGPASSIMHAHGVLHGADLAPGPGHSGPAGGPVPRCSDYTGQSPHGSSFNLMGTGGRFSPPSVRLSLGAPGPGATCGRFSPPSGRLLAPGPGVPGLPGVPTPFAAADMERVAVKLAHSFPGSPLAAVHLAMALRRRAAYLSSPSVQIRRVAAAAADAFVAPQRTELMQPDDVAASGGRGAALCANERRRRFLLKALQRGLHLGAQSAAGYIALVQLQLEEGQDAAALATAKEGLKFVAERNTKVNEKMRHAGMLLHLLAGQALLSTGELEGAARVFHKLASHVSDGEITFTTVVGQRPLSVRQHAIRGQAKVALARGQREAALALYERLVGRAVLGRGQCEWWAYAEYGTLLAEVAGDDTATLEVAAQHLETALDAAQRVDVLGQEGEAAALSLRLGQVYWRLGGPHRESPDGAYARLTAAAAAEGPWQAEAFAWLGRWAEEVIGNSAQARRCYSRALGLDPNLALAGDALCELLSSLGKSGVVSDVCREVLARAPGATWALRRLARADLAAGRTEDAVRSFQKAILAAPNDAELWEAMAAAYCRMGKHSSALKSFQRAVSLQPGRLYSQLQAASLAYQLGDTRAALEAFAASRASPPAGGLGAAALAAPHPAALLGEAEALLVAAHNASRAGAAGQAALQLQAAAQLSLQATRLHGNIKAGWKLLGDVEMQRCMAPPSAELQRLREAAGGAQSLEAAQALALAQAAAAQRARRAYSACLHLDPRQPGVWGDAATATWHELELRQAAGQPLQPEVVTAQRATTMRLVRGALRMEPSSNHLWSCMGTVSADVASREHAFCCALQLDAKDALAWTQLGRLYASHGEGGLAQSCFDSARSAEPTLVAVWEGMAYQAARSASGRQDSLDCAQHAVSLGGSPESWLGFAVGAAAGGRAAESRVLAAADKASVCLPLVAAAHNARGLACEARGQLHSASAAFAAAAALLQHPPAAPAHSSAGSDGLAAGEQVPTFELSSMEGDGRMAATGPADLSAMVLANLSRVLTRQGRGEEALAVMEGLGGPQWLQSDPVGRVARAHAMMRAGRREEAVAELRSVVEGGGPCARVQPAVLALVQVLMREGQADAAVAVVMQHCEAVKQEEQAAQPCESPHQRCDGQRLARLWLTVLAGLHVEGRGDEAAQHVAQLMMQWAANRTDVDSAACAAEAQRMHAAALAARGQAAAAVRATAAAVHLQPADKALRGSAAALALACGVQRWAAARLACPLVGSQRAPQGPAIAELLPGSHMPPHAALVRAWALLARVPAGFTAKAAVAEAGAWLRLLHMRPSSGLMWHVSALASLHAARVTGQACRFHTAAVLCHNGAVALQRELDALSPAANHGAFDGAAGDGGAAAADMTAAALRDSLNAAAVEVGLGAQRQGGQHAALQAAALGRAATAQDALLPPNRGSNRVPRTTHGIQQYNGFSVHDPLQALTISGKGATTASVEFHLNVLGSHRRMCAKVVHSKPWLEKAWSGLHLAAI